MTAPEPGPVGPSGGEPGPGSAGPTPPGDRNDPPVWAPAPQETPPETPHEIRESRILWVATALFSLVAGVLSFTTTSLDDLPPETRKTYTDVAAEGGVDVGQLMTTAQWIAALFAVLAAAVVLWLAARLARGRLWARTLLDLAGAFLVVQAVFVVVDVLGGATSLPNRSDMLTFAISSLQIIAGLCAGVAVWRQHLAPSTGFLAKVSGVGRR